MKSDIVVGITQGDSNGIGYEVIIKALSNPQILDICTPVVFGSLKLLSYYKKRIGSHEQLQFNLVGSGKEINRKRLNFINSLPEEFMAEPGRESSEGAKGAILSLERAVKELKEGNIDVLVTAPFNKESMAKEGFNFPGHTEYLTQQFGGEESLMFMVSEELKIALATNHLSLKEVSENISEELLQKKIKLLLNSLKRDFAILKPKIAVLGLNPHAGDGGLLGMEESEVVTPVIKEFFNEGELIFGPFSADGFFAHQSYRDYDAVLALYHDQAMIPFKILANERGVNYTAGLPIVRTSPDHGTAFDLAGKGEASHHSMLAAIFTACDIFKKREEYKLPSSNSLKNYLKSDEEREY